MHKFLKSAESRNSARKQKQMTVRYCQEAHYSTFAAETAMYPA